MRNTEILKTFAVLVYRHVYIIWSYKHAKIKLPILFMILARLCCLNFKNTFSNDFLFIDQEFNPKRDLEIRSGGTECYKLSLISMLFQSSSWSI